MSKLLAKKDGVKTDANGEVIFPDFKSEREEAEWWDKNSDFFMERLRKHGKVVYPTPAAKTRPISLRVEVDLIEKAKAIASKKGLGYQTVLKQAIRKGLKKTG